MILLGLGAAVLAFFLLRRGLRYRDWFWEEMTGGRVVISNVPEPDINLTPEEIAQIQRAREEYLRNLDRK